MKIVEYEEKYIDGNKNIDEKIKDVLKKIQDLNAK